MARKHTAFIMNSRRVSDLILLTIILFNRLTHDISQLMNQGRLFPKKDHTTQMQKEKSDQPTLSKLELLTTENGLVDSETDTENRNGLMVLCMRAIGRTIELTVRANLFTSMATFMMETGSMTKLMVLESITILMVLCMKVIGEMIFNMVKEKKAGPMDLSMKDSIWQERNMEWDSILGTMEVDIMENGLKIRLKDLVLTVG